MSNSAPQPGYEIEFFRRADGTEPVRRFMDSLTNDKRDALVAALIHVLGRQGLGVCATEWGKQLGAGLAEFRLRHDEREVLSARRPSGPEALPEASPERILLRVFFHAHGNRLILLLSGYDKGARPSNRQQQREIERARSYLEEWRADQARQRRTAPRTHTPRRRG